MGSNIWDLESSIPSPEIFRDILTSGYLVGYLWITLCITFDVQVRYPDVYLRGPRRRCRLRAPSVIGASTSPRSWLWAPILDASSKPRSSAASLVPSAGEQPGHCACKGRSNAVRLKTSRYARETTHMDRGVGADARRTTEIVCPALSATPSPSGIHTLQLPLILKLCALQILALAVSYSCWIVAANVTSYLCSIQI
jgi:hypothetical protein